MLIRKIQASDETAWFNMRSELWPEFKQDHPNEISAYFSGKSIDIEEVFIGEVSGEIMAFLEINIRNFAEGSRNSQVPYIEAWYVVPKYRNKGYGSKLINHAEQWALSQGFNELASDTEIDNTRSISLHQKMGFSETYRIVCFLKELKTS